MKFKSIRNRVGGGLVLLTVIAATSTSQAAYMAGDMILQGTLDLKNGSGTKVTDPIWYNKTTQLSFLTARTPSGSEDFDLVAGSAVWINPYQFTTQMTGNVLTIGGFTMELLDSSYEANTQTFGQFINISASVIFRMDGYDPTPGDFSLTITKTTLQSQQGGSVAGYTANFTPSVYNPISVPDGGTTAVMLGGTLLGLYGIRRVMARRAALSA